MPSATSARSLALGLDFGTDSARALLVDCATGEDVATGVAPYRRWAAGDLCDAGSQRFRQHPQDYLDALVQAVKGALRAAPTGSAAQVVGIGIDTTGSTPVAVDASGTPPGPDSRFCRRPRRQLRFAKRPHGHRRGDGVQRPLPRGTLRRCHPLCGRHRQQRVVVGHWRTARVQAGIADWQRAALGAATLATTRVARFGDNVRHVAVTDGDKVAAQLALGVTVDGYGLGDLVDCIRSVPEAEVQDIVADIEADCDLAPELKAGGARRSSLITEARTETGLRRFLAAGGYTALTDTFMDLHGLTQLPGLAIERLMRSGISFGAEGEWKTAALLRAVKVMGRGLPGGASFMVDYTYDLAEGAWTVLGAHMLKVCPSIAVGRPRVEVYP